MIKLLVLLGAQLVLIATWLLRLAVHYFILLASFLRFSYRLYVTLRDDNVERDVIPSENTSKILTTGAPDGTIAPTPIRELSVHERTRHHAELA